MLKWSSFTSSRCASSTVAIVYQVLEVTSVFQRGCTWQRTWKLPGGCFKQHIWEKIQLPKASNCSLEVQHGEVGWFRRVSHHRRLPIDSKTRIRTCWRIWYKVGYLISENVVSFILLNVHPREEILEVAEGSTEPVYKTSKCVLVNYILLKFWVLPDEYFRVGTLRKWLPGMHSVAYADSDDQESPNSAELRNLYNQHACNCRVHAKWFLACTTNGVKWSGQSHHREQNCRSHQCNFLRRLVSTSACFTMTIFATNRWTRHPTLLNLIRLVVFPAILKVHKDFLL